MSVWIRETRSIFLHDYTVFFVTVRSFYDKVKRDNSERLGFNYPANTWQVVNRLICEYEIVGRLKS